MSNRTVLEIVISVWLVISTIYVIHTPVGHRSHDFWQHFQVTELLVKNKAYPKPYAGWETYHPPLYYYINSFIRPDCVLSKKSFERNIHINYARSLSILYGLITILILELTLRKLNIEPLYRLISLLFLITIPKFVFVFSSYNNDSLGMLLSFSTIYLAMLLLEKNNSLIFLLLVIVSTMGLYTKLSFANSMILISLFCIFNIIKNNSYSKASINILLSFCVSSLMFANWMVYHNYKETKEYIPDNIKLINKKSIVNDVKSFKNIVFENPFKAEYWKSPYCYPAWEYTKPESKKRSYWAFSHVTSVIGEYTLKNPSEKIIFLILIIHLILKVISLLYIKKSPLLKGSLFGIIVLYAIQIVFTSSSFERLARLVPAYMDYRHIALSWLFWLIIYTSCLKNSSKNIRNIMIFLLGFCIFIHIYIITFIEGGYWW